jgi:hypothetical protein
MPQRTETVRRVQVGMVGLSVIIMLLLIGSAIVSRLRADPSKTVVTVPANTMEKSPDPAAKLSIAPANSPDNMVSPSAPLANQPNPTTLPLNNNAQPAATRP